MRKSITVAITIVMALLLAVSCSQQAEDSLCLVSFSAARSRDLTARIDYPAVNSLTWDITAVKADNGGTTGEGLHEGVLLTDEVGPFSAGRWTFTLEGKDDGGTVIYAGSEEAVIGRGTASVSVTVTPQGETGTLCLTGCNFPQFIGRVLFSSLNVYIDGRMRLGFTDSESELEGGYLWCPDKSVSLTAGIHDVRLELGGSETQVTDTFKVRIEGGLTTYVTAGTFVGNGLFGVVLEQREALAE